MNESSGVVLTRPEVLPIMRFFSHKHLPKDLAEISKPFGDLAWHIHDTLPPCTEKEKALDFLLIAKDSAVRSAIPSSPAPR